MFSLKRVAKVLVVGSFVSLFLVGCSSMPECGDTEVKDLLTQLIKEHAAEYFDVYGNEDDMKLSYDHFLLDSANETTKKIVCQAEATSKHDGEKETRRIKYSVQLTEDGTHIYVQLIDVNPF